MEGWIQVLIIVGIYCVIVLAVGVFSRDKGKMSLENYFVGNRSIGPFVAYFTYVATFHSSFAFLGAAGKLYSSGIDFFATMTSCIVSPMMIYLIGRPVWHLGKKYGYMTQGDLLGDYYQSKALRTVVALVSLVFLIPYLQAQIIGGGHIFESVTGGRIPFTWGCIILYAVIIGYILLGGFKAVAWTDTIQGIMMIVLVWIAGGVILGKVEGTLDWTNLMQTMADKYGDRLLIPIEKWPIFMTTFLSLFGISIYPPSFQRFYAVKNPKTLKWLAVTSPVYLIFFYVPIMIVAFLGVIHMPGVNAPDQILPLMLSKYTTPTLTGLVMAGALAATMSSADSQLHAASSIFTIDLFKPFSRKPVSDQKSLLVGRVTIVVIALIALLLSQFSSSLIMSISAFALGGCLQVLPSLIGAIYWKRGTKAGALAGLIAGVAVVLLTQFVWKTPFGISISSGAWGLLVNALTFVAVSLLTPKPDPAQVEKVHGSLAAVNREQDEAKAAKRAAQA